MFRFFGRDLMNSDITVDDVWVIVAIINEWLCVSCSLSVIEDVRPNDL